MRLIVIRLECRAWSVESKVQWSVESVNRLKVEWGRVESGWEWGSGCGKWKVDCKVDWKVDWLGLGVDSAV